MFTKKALITGLIIASLLILFSAFILPKASYEKLNIGASILASISSLFTLVIALLLYEKLVIDESLLEKQTENVLALLNEIEKSQFLFFSEEYANRFEPINVFKESGFLALDKHPDTPIAISYELDSKLENITRYNRNIYIPTDIAEKLEDLKILFFGTLEGDDFLGNYIFVVSDSFGAIDEIRNNPNRFGTPSVFKDVTVSDYIEKWREILRSIDKWLTENSSKNLDLNFTTDMEKTT